MLFVIHIFCFFFWLQVVCQVHDLLLDPGLVEEDDLRVDSVLDEVLDPPHGQHLLLAALVAVEDGQQRLQAGQDLLRRGGAA